VSHFCHTGPRRPAPVWLARVVGSSDRPPPSGGPSTFMGRAPARPAVQSLFRARTF